jgi:hypothetical protein
MKDTRLVMEYEELSLRLRYCVEGYSVVNGDIGVEGLVGFEGARCEVCYKESGCQDRERWPRAVKCYSV